MMYVRYPLSLRQVEDLLSELGIDIRHETVLYWWNRFGPLIAAEIRKRRFSRIAGLSSSPFGLHSECVLNALSLLHHFAMRQDFRKLCRVDTVHLHPLRNSE